MLGKPEAWATAKEPEATESAGGDGQRISQGQA